MTLPSTPPLDTGPWLTPDSVSALQEMIREAARTGKRIAFHRASPAGALKLTLDRLDRILEIDADDLLARVEAGIRLGALTSALQTKGLRFIPGDGPFNAQRSIGELYRQGLDHARSLKYGAAKHFLLGSRMVLASGEVVATGGRTVKNVTGYDLTRFFNAPLTTFGVTVELILKLHAVPPARRSFLVRFASSQAACAFAIAARRSIRPAYLVWMDPQAQQIAGGTTPEAHLVLFELDGVPDEVADASAAASVLIQGHQGALKEVAIPELESLAAVFDSIAPARGLVLANEIKIDAEALPGFMDRFAATIQTRGLQAGLLGKLAEGALSILIERSPEDPATRIAKILEAAVSAGARLAGSWSRAVNLISSPLPDLERLVAAQLDPRGIFAW